MRNLPVFTKLSLNCSTIFRPISPLLCVLLLLPALPGCAQDQGGRLENAKVTVQPTQVMVINGQKQVQSRIFGVTAYEAATLPATQAGREQLQRIRLPIMGLAGNIHWCAPETMPQNGVQGIEAWYRSAEAKTQIRDGLLYGSKYLLGRILPGLRKADVEPMVYLRGGPAWAVDGNGVPLNDEIYAALVTSYVGLLREIDPGLRLFHLLNEPNNFYHLSKKGGADYARTYVAVSRALKKRFPTILLGGTVACWPPAYPLRITEKPQWYLWDEWTAPFLEIAGKDLDFFDFHHYDKVSREDRSEFIGSAQEEILLISAAMESKLGRRVPVYITEWGLPLTVAEWGNPEAHWRRRTLPSARFLLEMLDLPDKVVSLQLFDLGAQLNERENHSLLDMADFEKQTPTYWLYWIMRHTRGIRLTTQVEGAAPGLKVIATRTLPDTAGTEPELALVMFNDSEVPRQVSLEFVGVPRWINTPRWERLFLDKGTKTLKRDAGMSKSLLLPPQSLAVATANIPRETPYANASEERDFQSPTILQPFGANRNSVTFPVTVPRGALAGNVSGKVRVGLQGSALQDSFSLTLGGMTYAIPGGTHYLEIPLGALPAAGVNQVVVKRLSEAGTHLVRVTAVSLVLTRKL